MNSNEAQLLKTWALELLQKMIAVPAFSREEKAVSKLFSDELTAQGVSCTSFLNNVYAKNLHFDEAKLSILLNSHLDTVKPGAGYTRDPFFAEISEGKLYGLGSNDAGAPLVALAAAFRHFHARADLKYNLVFAASAEEEISGANGTEALLGQLPKFDCAIVGEPTSLQMAVAEKGLLVLDCTTFGRSGHAAREEGDNAIYKALPDLEWFRNYHFSKVSPLLGPNKMSVTLIQSGTQHNVVPRECTYTVDVRVNELYDFETVLKEIRASVKSEVKPRSQRIKSTSIELDHPLVKAGHDLGLTHYGSPTTSDKALMPFPALKLGPGDSARSHTSDEFVYLEQINQGIDLYIALLEKVILNS